MPKYGMQGVQTITGEAGVDLSAKQYYFASLASDGQFDPTGDGARVDGVIYSWSAAPSAAGRPFTLAIAGVVNVVAGAAVTKGDLVASDASGKVVTAAQNDEIAGIAMETASGDGSVIPILLKLSGRAPKP